MGNKKFNARRKQLYMTSETDSDLDFLAEAWGNISRSRLVRQLVSDEMERTIRRNKRAADKRSAKPIRRARVQ